MAASFSPGFAGTPNLASAHRSTPDCLNPFDINPLRAIIEKLFDFERCRSRDLVIVLLLPLSRPATPTTAEAIRSRLTEIHFNTTFLTEMRDLALSRRAARRATLFRGRLEQRLLDLNLHMIETEEKVSQLAVEKTLNTSLPFLLRLKEEGRARAESWLSHNRAALGWRSTLDLDRFAA